MKDLGHISHASFEWVINTTKKQITIGRHKLVQTNISMGWKKAEHPVIILRTTLTSTQPCHLLQTSNPILSLKLDIGTFRKKHLQLWCNFMSESWPTVIRGMENKITQSQTAQYIHKIGGLNFARWKIWHVFLAHLDRWPFVKPESQNYFKRREFLNPWEDRMLPPMDSTVHLHENKQWCITMQHQNLLKYRAKVREDM